MVYHLSPTNSIVCMDHVQRERERKLEEKGDCCNVLRVEKRGIDREGRERERKRGGGGDEKERPEQRVGVTRRICVVYHDILHSSWVHSTVSQVSER